MISTTPRLARGAAAAALVGALALTGCTATQSGSDAMLTIPREDMGTFSQNFNPFAPTSAPMTKQAIYEPLFVYNPANGETTPWLAESWEVADDGLSATFDLRDDVLWSDGEAFTAEDVEVTFDLQVELLGGFDYLEDVAASDPDTVVFAFNRAFSPALFEIGGQVIAPAHVWSEQEDPAGFENPTPVGTGPYTEVTNFQAQSFDLLPNPNYWQPDAQHIAGVRMLAFSGNDGANLALQSGDADWGDQFIPDVQTTFVDRAPETNHYWYPTTGSMIHWQLNTTLPMFQDPAVRTALSMAIDREQITDVAMVGYTEPADCTGLSGGYDTWRDQELADSCTSVTFDPDAAAAALDAAGYTLGADGARQQPDGSPFTFSISVGSASSDWLSAANIIAQNLADIGIQAPVDSPDWAAVVAGYETGEFETGIVWSANAPTPYQFYRNTMSTETVMPVGEQSFDNYHRFGNAEADDLLAQFAASTDEAEQHEIVDQLQALYAEQMPVVPLFPGPEWGAYSDARFTGWPSAEDPYATLATRGATTVLVLTSLEPVEG